MLLASNGNFDLTQNLFNVFFYLLLHLTAIVDHLEEMQHFYTCNDEIF